MLKAAVPSADRDQQAARPGRLRRSARQDGARRSGRGAVAARCGDGLRASCFQSATRFSSMRDHGGALDHLDQPDLAEVGQQRAERRARWPTMPTSSMT